MPAHCRVTCSTSNRIHPWILASQIFRKHYSTASESFPAKSWRPPTNKEEDGCFDRGLVREMGQLGFLAPELDEAWGGSGLDVLTSGLITEIIAEGDMNVAYVPINHSLISSCIVRHGHPDVIAEVLPAMCAGDTIACIGLTEPRGGSDAANLVLNATHDGESYILNGENFYFHGRAGGHLPDLRPHRQPRGKSPRHFRFCCRSQQSRNQPWPF